MLDSPLRIFRCYICVENRIEAPLQDLSLLVEHLARHFDFYLYECRGCKGKYVTPFIANFHIKEGKCKKEEGELCDDGGPPLIAVDLETVEFASFCRIQNAITKCTELMLYELNYGEEDLLHCLNANKLPSLCPVSPEPIIREERLMQTSPPHDPTPPSNPGPSAEAASANPSSAEPSAPPILAPPPPPPPAHLLAPPPAPPAVLDMDLEDGFSLISDDELEPSTLPRVGGDDVDDGFSIVSSTSDSSTSASSMDLESPEQNPPSARSPPPSSSPPSTISIPSLMSLSLKKMVDHDLPPRRDVRQQVVVPERPCAPAPADYVEANSSTPSSSTAVAAAASAAAAAAAAAAASSAIPPSFFFQAPQPTNPPRPMPSDDRPSLNDPVYPVLAPVYSAGVRIYPGANVVFSQCFSSGQVPPPPTVGMMSSSSTRHYGNRVCGINAQGYSAAMPSTSSAPAHERMRPTEILPLFPKYPTRLPSSEQRQPIPCDVAGERGGIRPPFEADGEEEHPSAVVEVAASNDAGGGAYGGEEEHRRSGVEEWVGCAEVRPTPARPRPDDEPMRRAQEPVPCVHVQNQKPRFSYGITVLHSFNPHLNKLERKRHSVGRRSMTMSRMRETNRGRSRTAGPPRSRLSRSRSRRRRASPSPSSSKRPRSSQRGSPESRHRSESPSERFQIFPASVLDGDMSDDGLRELESIVAADDSQEERPRSTHSVDDMDVREVIERTKARASRSATVGRVSRFSDWKKRHSKQAEVRSPALKKRQK